MSIVVTLLLVIIAATVFLAWRYSPADHSQYDQPITPPLMRDDEVSSAHQQVVAKLHDFVAKQSRDVQISRQQMEELFYREVDATITPVDAGGVPGEWVVAEGADPSRRLLYLHGGAFRVGSPKSHRHITYELSRRAGLAVLAVDYRMQPEHKMIACHEDARIAYDWIIKHGPDGEGEAASLFVAGDSAGGNLTLSLIAWARDTRRRAVDGAIALAPLTDGTFSSPTWKNNLKTDPFLGPAFSQLMKIPLFVVRIVSRPTSGLPVNHPVMSPLLGPLDKLPPTLIQVSRDEMLYGDAQRYANKADAAGSPVTLQVWPKMVHVFQGFPELPESDDAFARMADFIAEQSETKTLAHDRVAS